jgi:acetyl esterase/lipase
MRSHLLSLLLLATLFGCPTESDDDDVTSDDDDVVGDDDSADDDDVVGDDDSADDDDSGDDDDTGDDDDATGDDDDTTGPVRYLDEVFTGIDETPGIAYGSAVWFGDTDRTPLTLNLFEPAGDTEQARAALVWIHGGGFVAGSASQTQITAVAEAFTRRGYVCVSINYRLRTAAEFSDQPTDTIRDAVHDGRAAVRWMRANAATYRIDPDRIGIGGGSAGAITSLGVAYADQFGEGDSGSAGFSSDVRAVVDFWGSLPGANDTMMEAGEAPLIIIHGTEDVTVPYAEAEELVARAQEVGVPYSFHPLQGQGHGAWGNQEQFAEWIPPFLYEHVIE